MRQKEKKEEKLVNQQFISFTIYHWLSLYFLTIRYVVGWFNKIAARTPLAS